MVMKDFKSILKSEELRAYIIMYVTAVTIIVIDTLSILGNLGLTIRNAIFQIDANQYSKRSKEKTKAGKILYDQKAINNLATEDHLEENWPVVYQIYNNHFYQFL